MMVVLEGRSLLSNVKFRLWFRVSMLNFWGIPGPALPSSNLTTAGRKNCPFRPFSNRNVYTYTLIRWDFLRTGNRDVKGQGRTYIYIGEIDRLPHVTQKLAKNCLAALWPGKVQEPHSLKIPGKGNECKFSIFL